ncbi:RagB/SusD family nutrient uptake outer membrane protein [Chitinophaga qingshengii]|uniref:RagB/SusD family nutrient uptake outer membrane protein n=1 Tax=Chitinophaga qingshengii TaxID=1569794 RepID=A0ABR7TYR8_9BACT|nr:RagB/SusD family nutrient uptake outer membrane protein [Chitinophaga qingshengii]MBC9934932.1 RagB/SusD family nutrient uptake outer membrane protein [Chitinophaga qingshengii]
MRKIIYILLLVSCAWSCTRTLDVAPGDKYSNGVVWKNTSNLDLYVNSLYGALYQFSEIGGPDLSDGYSDILKYSQTYMDTYHNRVCLSPAFLSPATTEAVSPWSAAYGHIRKLNEFIIDAGKYGSNINASDLAVRLAEIRFLRAFVYSKLITRHGGVVLRVDDEKLDGPAEKNKARATTAASWQWVTGELKAIAEQLPEAWDNNGTGRITKGAAYALLARAALYAEQWDDAISAGRKVEAMKYALVNNFEEVFSTPHNKEIILAAYYKRPDLTNNFDRYFAPTGDIERYGGYASPTEELVSQFDIKTGNRWERFSWDNPDHKANPYTNRDPRFYATILYNGAPWKGRTLQTYAGGTDSYIEYFDGNARNRSVTGYFIRKFLENKVKDFVAEKGDQYWIEIRYAEIITILSEAYGRGKNDFITAYRYLNMLRERPGVGLPPLPVKDKPEEYLNDLQKEKMCEFAFEGHRYWDLRRWKKAGTVLNGVRMHGMEIKKTGDSYEYNLVDCDKADRFFPERYYTMPIPDFEIKNNLACKQDPAWQ